MTDKQINRWLRRRFSQVGWVMVAYYGILNVLAVAAMLWESLRQFLFAVAAGKPGQMNNDAVLGNGWGYIATILTGVVILRAWKGRDYWKEEILKKERAMEPGVLVCLLVFCMGSQMVNGLWVSGLELILSRFGMSVMQIMESVSGSSDTFSMFLYASVLAPIGEEILFRGYVLRSLRPYGKRFAVLGSAVLFGLFHGNLLQTPYAVLVGLILGYVTVEYSILWAVLIHMFNNLVLADLLTRLTASWPETAYAVLNTLLFGGALLASVVLLIRRRREIREYRQSEWMDRRVLKCFFLNSGVLVMTLIALVNIIALLFV